MLLRGAGMRTLEEIIYQAHASDMDSCLDAEWRVSVDFTRLCHDLVVGASSISGHGPHSLPGRALPNDKGGLRAA